jgi:hypothetical protein
MLRDSISADWAYTAIEMGSEQHLRDALALICDLRGDVVGLHGRACSDVYYSAYKDENEWALTVTAAFLSTEEVDDILKAALESKYSDGVEAVRRLCALRPPPARKMKHRNAVNSTRFSAVRMMQLSQQELEFVLEYLDVHGLLLVQLCRYPIIREDHARKQLLFQHSASPPDALILWAADQTYKTFATVFESTRVVPKQSTNWDPRYMTLLRKASVFRSDDKEENQSYLQPNNDEQQRLEIVKVILSSQMAGLPIGARYNTVAGVLDTPRVPDCILNHLRQELGQLGSCLQDRARLWIPRLVQLLVLK